MPTIFVILKEAFFLLSAVIFAIAVSNLATYLIWGHYMWPVVYEDKDRTILVDFLFGWIDAREL